MPKLTTGAFNATSLPHGFRSNAVAGGGVEIMLYGDIGDEYWGMIGQRTVMHALRGVSENAAVHVRINSMGGSIYDAQGIYNLLKNWKGDVTVDIEGFALSSASWIALAGDTVRMAQSGLMMMHDPINLIWGNSRQLRQEADVLDTMRDTIAGIYAARTGKSVDEFKKKMADDTWLTAQEALDLGLIDEIVPNKQPADGVSDAVNTRLDFTRLFKNIPQALRDAASNSAATPPIKENQSMTKDQFNAYAAENPDAAQPFLKQGEKTGRANANADLKAMLATFPGEEKFATDQYLTGRSIEEAKQIHEQIKAAVDSNKKTIDAKDKEIADLKAKLEGQGGVNTAGAAAGTAGKTADDNDPKSKAEAEWDADSKVRNEFKGNKDRYVRFRVAELSNKIKLNK